MIPKATCLQWHSNHCPQLPKHGPGPGPALQSFTTNPLAVVFNPLTHNFQSLVLHCIVLLHDARTGKNQRPAANALRLVASVSVGKRLYV